MPINRRSRNITEGVARAPNRSMYYALGYEEGDFKQADDRRRQRPLDDHAVQLGPAEAGRRRRRRHRGGRRQRRRSSARRRSRDGMAMGTEGMKYSLVSREVIADCIETCVGGQWMDGVLVDRRLRQEHARRHDGHPARQRAGDLRLRRHHPARAATRARTSTSSACSRRSASSPPATMSEEDFGEIERRAIPGSGSCGGMYTANTMSSAFEALGMSLPYSSTMANVARRDRRRGQGRRRRCWSRR